MKAQKCAVDAAPFLHPRLSAIQMNVNHTKDRRPDASAPITEVEDEFRRLRSAPTITIDHEPQDEDA